MRFLLIFHTMLIMTIGYVPLSFADDSAWKPAKNGHNMGSTSEDDAFVPAKNGHSAEGSDDGSFAPAQNGFNGANKSTEQKSQNGSILKGRVWNIPKEEKESSSEEKKTSANKNSTNTNPANTNKDGGKNKKPDTPEKELTPEQKLWEKYKTLADAGAQKKQTNETKKEQKDSEENHSSDGEEKNVEQQKDKQAEGLLQGILQDYKSKQKGATLNTRSFGSID